MMKGKMSSKSRGEVYRVYTYLRSIAIETVMTPKLLMDMVGSYSYMTVQK